LLEKFTRVSERLAFSGLGIGFTFHPAIINISNLLKNHLLGSTKMLSL
jgi:hypothetical protein